MGDQTVDHPERTKSELNFAEISERRKAPTTKDSSPRLVSPGAVHVKKQNLRGLVKGGGLRLRPVSVLCYIS